MADPKIIKQFEHVDCPHCGKLVIVGSQTMMPAITSVNKQEDVAKAKAIVLQRLDEVSFKNDKDKENIVVWLNEETTIIDHSDIESLLKQIAIEQLNENKDDIIKGDSSN